MKKPILITKRSYLCLLVAVLLLMLPLVGCSQEETPSSSNGANLSEFDLGEVPPPVEIPDIPEAPETEYERLKLGNSPALTFIPNVTMVSHYGPYIDYAWALMDRNSWLELPNATIPDGVNFLFTFQFYSGKDYYAEGEDNIYDYPLYLFYDDDTVVFDWTDWADEENPVKYTIRYQMPSGGVENLTGFLEGVGLFGSEYVMLFEPFTRLTYGAELRASVNGEALWDVREQMADNRAGFIRALGLDFSAADGLESWTFEPVARPASDTSLTVLVSEWYAVRVYPGWVSIQDRTMPEAPLLWYRTPDNVQGDVNALLDGYR